VKLTNELRANGQKVITFSQSQEADLTAEDVTVSLMTGTSFVLKTHGKELHITSPLVGKPHVYNMLSATAVALELGYDIDSISRGFSKCIGAPGRFERVPNAGDFAVVVDYAHTDDALLNTLKTARDLTRGRIITVFGCGGDRDQTKRRPMGEIAARYSDSVIITSDNPRNEDPLKIISEIETGVKERTSAYEVVPDRRDAIHRAVSAARKEKGHETYQIIGSDKFHFDDREVAAEALSRLAEAA